MCFWNYNTKQRKNIGSWLFFEIKKWDNQIQKQTKQKQTKQNKKHKKKQTTTKQKQKEKKTITETKLNLQ